MLYPTSNRSLNMFPTSTGHVERELVREGEKLSDMLAMPVKDALGRDLQLDYSAEIAQLRRQIDESRRRRQVCGHRLALQRLTLEQVTHIHAYEEDARRARDWLQELYAVLLRCHSHVGCNIHEIQLQKDELQGFEETGRVSFPPVFRATSFFFGNKMVGIHPECKTETGCACLAKVSI